MPDEFPIATLPVLVEVAILVAPVPALFKFKTPEPLGSIVRVSFPPVVMEVVAPESVNVVVANCIVPDEGLLIVFPFCKLISLVIAPADLVIFIAFVIVPAPVWLRVKRFVRFPAPVFCIRVLFVKLVDGLFVVNVATVDAAEVADRVSFVVAGDRSPPSLCQKPALIPET